MQYGIKTALVWAVLLLLAALVVPTTYAQGSDNVDVRVVITGIVAENLNEDSITDDGRDEMVFFYNLYELDADGRVLQNVGHSTEYYFRHRDRASGSNFSDLRLVAAPDNRVVFIIYAVEIDAPVNDENAESCGTAAPAAVLACLSGGDCGDLNIDLLEQCVGDIRSALTASKDDLFENAHVRFIDTTELGTELEDIDIRDVGFNSAEYEVEYTIVKAATTAEPTLTETDNAAHWIYFGRLESGSDRASWNFTLDLGQTAFMRATPFSGDLDTALKLFDVDGGIVAENNDAVNFDTTNAILDYSARLGGNFTVEVSRGHGSTSGDYFLEIIIQ